MTSKLIFDRAMVIAKQMSLLKASELAGTAAYGHTTQNLENIQSFCKQTDENMWIGVVPNTFDAWIRKIESISVKYREEEIKGFQVSVEKRQFKGDITPIQLGKLTRYLLKIGETILNAKDELTKSQAKVREQKLVQTERKRKLEKSALVTGKKSSKSSSSAREVSKTADNLNDDYDEDDEDGDDEESEPKKRRYHHKTEVKKKRKKGKDASSSEGSDSESSIDFRRLIKQEFKRGDNHLPASRPTTSSIPSVLDLIRERNRSLQLQLELEREKNKACPQEFSSSSSQRV